MASLESKFRQTVQSTASNKKAQTKIVRIEDQYNNETYPESETIYHRYHYIGEYGKVMCYQEIGSNILINNKV